MTIVTVFVTEINFILLESLCNRSFHCIQDALRTFAKNPIIGEGVASGRVMSDIQYGRILREVGLLGFFSFLWIMITLLKIGWRTFRNIELDEFSRGLSLGYFCAVIGLLVMGIGAEVFIIIRIMEPFWFLTAIVVALPEVNETSVSAARVASKSRVVTAALVTVFSSSSSQPVVKAPLT